MDRTAVAAELLDTLPAHRTLGLRVLSAMDGAGRVTLPVDVTVQNVVGALHSSGVTALVDAAALAALVSLAPDDEVARRIQPLGTRAELAFHRPVRVRAVAVCRLTDETARQLADLYAGHLPKARVATRAVVAGVDEPSAVDGEFEWTVRLGA